MLDVFEDWGRRLLAAAIAYSIVSTIIVYAYVSVGLQPPPLVPATFIAIYEKAYKVWSDISGAVMSGSALSVAYAVVNSFGAVVSTTIALLAQTAVTYVWLAVLATRTLPWPFTILAVPIWVAGVFANTVMLFYLIRKTIEMVQRLLGMAAV